MAERDERTAARQRYVRGALARSYAPEGIDPPRSVAARERERAQWRALSRRQRALAVGSALWSVLTCTGIAIGVVVGSDALVLVSAFALVGTLLASAVASTAIELVRWRRRERRRAD